MTVALIIAPSESASSRLSAVFVHELPGGAPDTLALRTTRMIVGKSSLSFAAWASARPR